MTSITSAILLLRILAVSQVLLLAFALATSPNPHRTRLVGVALALGAVSYLMSAPALDYVNLGASRWFALPADAIPPLLFMFSWYLFEDDRRLPMKFWIVAAAYAVATSWIGLADIGSAGPYRAPVMMALQIVKLGFVIGSIFIAWTGREVDVVESRLRFRRIFAASIGIIVTAVVTTELVAAWQVPAVIELFGMTAIFIATLSINLAFLRLNPTFALSSPRPTPSPPAEGDPLVDQLRRLMKDKKAYVNPDLRIADLATSAKVPEYVLRRTINRDLGYRNFNQFVNKYRVEAAAVRLVREPRTPVLTIALDVGFRSISSFNSAFQARYKTVPTQYRKDGLTDS